jgi:hypothetical protein
MRFHESSACRFASPVFGRLPAPISTMLLAPLSIGIIDVISLSGYVARPMRIALPVSVLPSSIIDRHYLRVTILVRGKTSTKPDRGQAMSQAAISLLNGLDFVGLGINLKTVMVVR